MVETNQLLQEFAQNGSEDAFRELVKRYVNLVYTVARRRLGGDAHLAQDVAQTVFVDFARQARKSPTSWLEGSAPVAGWLHRHTCFVSATLLRSTRRRQLREQVAVEMNLLQSDDTQHLAPELDEAIHQLHGEDRDALLLRFYEQRDLRTVGNALGISEDAAQKRVARAIEKLRGILLQRGVTLSTVALTAFLGENALQSAPAGLGDRLADAALAGTASGLALLLASFIKFASTAKGALVIGGAALALIGLPLLLLSKAEQAPLGGDPRTDNASLNTASNTRASSNQNVALDATAASDESAVADTNGLHLLILAKENDQPIPGVAINYRAWIKDRFLGRKQFRANRAGQCLVDIEPGLTWLELITHSDGFADTCLQWRPDRGETVPESYTVRLARAVRIGGRVVDAQGQAVAGAKVGFNSEQDPLEERRPESHDFKWIEVETDQDGRWRIERIAPEVISRIYGSAQHPDYTRSAMVFVSRDAQAAAQLRAEEHVFTLSPALAVRGAVVDQNQQPVEGAKVIVGSIGQSTRPHAVAAADGTFVVRGCKLGENTLTADAEGYAPAALRVNVSEKTEPVRFVLSAGPTLILRVTNKDGVPMSGVGLWFDAFERGMPGQRNPLPQINFSPTTDSEGLVIWSNAPNQELTFNASKTGFMRVNDIKVRPDDQEHRILLPPALVIEGTVQDAESGQSIPKFRLVCGSPGRPTQEGQPQWSTLDRFWPSFAGGVFRHSLEEPVIVITPHPGYQFKFEAEGYAPLVTRRIAADEGTVRLEVKLQKNEGTTITVLRPDGNPAARIDVALVSLSTRVELTQNGFSRRDGSSAGALLRTDESGRVKIVSDPAVQRIVAASAEGYGEATPAALKTQATLRMGLWGGLRGIAWRRGQPLAGAIIAVQPLTSSLNGLLFDYESFKTVTDDKGAFQFPHVPPGRHRVVRFQPMEDSKSFQILPLGEVEIKAGEVTELDLEKSGCTVTARLPWPPTIQRQPNLRLHGEVATPVPFPPAEIRQDPQAISKWVQEPAVAAAMEAARNNYRTWPLRQLSDGSWESDPLAPGPYILHVYVSDSNPSAQPTSLRAHTQLEITVPDNTAELDLGEVAW